MSDHESAASELCPACPFLQLRREANEQRPRSQSDDSSVVLRELELHHIMLGLQQQEIVRVRHEAETSRQRYLSLFAFSPTAFVTCNAAGEIIEANAAFYILLESAPHQLDDTLYRGEHSSLYQFFCDEDRHAAQQHIGAVFGSVPPAGITLRMIKDDKQTHWVRLTARRIDLTDQEAIAIVALTDLSLEQERLQQSETLLRELNHRIKNSMGLILSILQMESQRGANCVDIKGIMIRVHALSKVYDRLYQRDLSDSVDIGSYAQELFESLILGFAGPTHQLNLFCTTETLHMGAKRGMSIGLILTELLSNALRYGFPGGYEGELGLEIAQDEEMIRCQVWNRGQASLKNDFSIQHDAGTGLQIVYHLTHQLGGELHICPGERPTFSLAFPVEA